MRTTIRRARPSDARRLTRIAHAAKRHWGYPERWIRAWREDLTVTPEGIANRPVYCAVRNRTVVGFYGLSAAGEPPEIEHLWVDPPHIATGVGRRLFTHLVRRLRSMRATRLRIASDPNAAGFYRRMGARRVGRVPSTPQGRYLPLLAIDLRRKGAPCPPAS